MALTKKFLLILLSTLLTPQLIDAGSAPSMPFAALCVSQSTDCAPEQASLSEHCRSGLSPAEQPTQCQKNACKYCSWKSSKDKAICKTENIKAVCDPTRKVGSLDQRYGAAALCMSRTKNCREEDATRSVYCKDNTYVARQPLACRRAGCMYCFEDTHKDETACLSWAVKTWCYERAHEWLLPKPRVEPESNPASNTPEPSPETTENPAALNDKRWKNPEDCLWVGKDDKVVLGLKYFKPTKDWKHTAKSGDGLTWRPWKEHGIDKRGSGEMCFNFKAPTAGFYYLTALSSAPHRTEYNDMWIKLDRGLRLYRARTAQRKGSKPRTGYEKAYQNHGRNEKSNLLSGVNHKPHRFITEWLTENRVYTMCMSGRSSKFTVYKLVMIRCVTNPGQCMRTSKYIRDMMKVLPNAECE